MRLARWFGLVGIPLLVGCTTYRDELVRAQSAYDANNHELALALTRAVDPNLGLLTAEERVRYAYLRGMSNFHIGFRAEARHYLALARALENEHRGALPNDWKSRLDEALGTLNTEVYQSGIASLSLQEAELSAKKPKKK